MCLRCYKWSFRKLPKSSWYTAEKVICSASTLLLTSRNKSCTSCMVLAESATYGFSGKCFKWKTRYRWQATSFLIQRALYFRPSATKLSQLVEYARRVQVLAFQEKPSSGNWDTAKEVLRSSSKLPVIIDQSQPNWYPLQGDLGDHQVWSFRKISQTEAEIQPRRDFVQQGK